MLGDIVQPLRLATSRLRLRPIEEPDWRPMHDHYSNLDCTRYTYGRAMSEGESWRTVASLAGHWLLRGYGPYAVCLAHSGELSGVVGLWFPGDWPEPEIMWALRPQHWGKGYAREAVAAVRSMVTEQMPGLRPISFIDARNERSIRLAQGLSARFESEADFRGSPWRIYRHGPFDRPITSETN